MIIIVQLAATNMNMNPTQILEILNQNLRMKIMRLIFLTGLLTMRIFTTFLLTQGKQVKLTT